MNLSAYDLVKDFSKVRNYVDVKYKRLHSWDIPYKKYYAIAKRWSPSLQRNNYYIIVTDNELDDPVCRYTYSPSPNKTRFDLNDIWKTSDLCKFKVNTEIDVTLVDNQEDCIIFELNI